MGICKAELDWNGTTLIEHQVNKMRSLGIDDIIISGYPKPVEGTRFVADKYPSGDLWAEFTRVFLRRKIQPAL